VKVSVVIPTYNRAYIILEALESVLTQTYRDFEIIVVDDGSTDTTFKIIQSMEKDKIRYIRHDRNKGCSAAYNSGIAAASGDLIGFLDSDDKWKPNYLEEQVDFLKRHPDVDAVFTDTEIRSDTGHAPSLVALMRAFPRLLQLDPQARESVISSRQMYLCLLEEVPIKPSAVVVRRELFGRAGTFDEAWPSGTDWELFLRFSRSASFGYINRPLVVQKQTSDSTFLKFMEQDKQLLLKVALREKTNLRNDPEALLAVNRGISDHCNNLAWVYLHCGKKRKSISVYVRGFKETHEFIMLVRAASVLMPLGVRNLLKRTVKRTHAIPDKVTKQP
jgi:glycosyltransferase involved in cell wall biosynthesis